MSEKIITENYFKYCSADLAILCLETQRLSWSSSLLFNDPFDNQMNMLLEDDREKMVEDFMSRLIDVVDGKIVPDYDLESNGEVVKVLQYIKNIAPEEYQSFLNLAKVSISESIYSIDDEFEILTGPITKAFTMLSILCLSKTGDNLLMWSHYADNHKGVVLKFKASSAESVFKEAKSVNYSKSFAKYNIKELRDDSNGVIDKYVLTKSIDWQYEQEWRIFKPLTDQKVPRELRPFDPNDLEAIYLGCRISDISKTTIISLRDRFFPDAKIYQAERSSKGFSLLFGDGC